MKKRFGIWFVSGTAILLACLLPVSLYAGLVYFSANSTDRRGEPVFLFHSTDTLYGNIHCNDYFCFDSPPNIFGYISTYRETFVYREGMNLERLNLLHSPIFGAPHMTIWDYGGFRYNARWVEGGNLYMTRIWLRGNDGITIYQYELGENPPPLYDWEEDDVINIDHWDPHAWSVIFINGPVEVCGEVYGNLTISSSGDMWLVDNIYYTDMNSDGSGFDWRNAQHWCGLVSEGDIIIKDNEWNGKDNGYSRYDRDDIDHHSITITAALAALGGSLRIEHTNADWEAYQGPNPDERGVIHLIGVLLQYGAEPFHNDNHEGTGYNLDWRCDERFNQRRPWYFPGYSEFIIEGVHVHIYIDDMIVVVGYTECKKFSSQWRDEIRFNSDYDLIVRGEVTISGRADAPVIFGWLRHYPGGEPARFATEWGGYVPQVNVRNAIFEEGVAVDFDADTIRIDSSSFVEPVRLHGRWIEIRNCTFGGDVDIDGWGEIAFERNLIEGGLTIAGPSRSCRIVNNTIVNPDGDGVFLDNYRDAELNSNIIAFCQRGIVRDNWNDLRLLYNDVYGNQDGDYVDCAPGEGSISVDPLFENLFLSDYRLTPNSRCIDAGDPNLPEDPDGTRADIGAFWLHRLSIDEIANAPDKWGISASPNPFNQTAEISFMVEHEGMINISVFDLQGRRALNKKEYHSPGKVSWRLDGSHLGGSGVYIVNVVCGDNRGVLKLVYLR